METYSSQQAQPDAVPYSLPITPTTSPNSNKKVLYIVLGLVLFLCVTISSCVGLFIYVNQTKKTDDKKEATVQTPTPKMYPAPQKDAPITESYISQAQKAIPEFTADEFAKTYPEYPKAYNFSEPVDTKDIKTIKNAYGMVVPYISDKIPTPLGSTINSLEKDFCAKCAAEMSAMSNTVQYREFESYPYTDSNDIFRITFFQQPCFNEDTLESLTVRENLYRRTQFLTPTPGSNFYYYGRVNVAKTTFKNFFMVYWIQDNDGVVDATTKYVVDYNLEDQYGRKYKHTVRGTKKYLEDNYNKIAQYLASFKTEENIFTVPSQCPDETDDHYVKRSSAELKKLAELCKKNSKCFGYVISQTAPESTWRPQIEKFQKANFMQPALQITGSGSATNNDFVDPSSNMPGTIKTVTITTSFCNGDTKTIEAKITKNKEVIASQQVASGKCVDFTKLQYGRNDTFAFYLQLGPNQTQYLARDERVDQIANYADIKIDATYKYGKYQGSANSSISYSQLKK